MRLIDAIQEPRIREANGLDQASTGRYIAQMQILDAVISGGRALQPQDQWPNSSLPLSGIGKVEADMTERQLPPNVTSPDEYRNRTVTYDWANEEHWPADGYAMEPSVGSDDKINEVAATNDDGLA